MPRIIHISIARYRPDLPDTGQSLDFLVSIHEEGTGITWQQNVIVDWKIKEYIINSTSDLFLWSKNIGLTLKKANSLLKEIGECLYKTFIGTEGEKVLERINPTAILFNIDETIMSIPWELIGFASEKFALDKVPFGRLVTTRMLLREGRNPLQQDSTVRILAVINPTSDLSPAEGKYIATLHELTGQQGRFQVEVDMIVREQATLSNFKEKIAAGDYDMLHFGGHGFLNQDNPGLSALRFADGELSADDVLTLQWKNAPPCFVFSSACESSGAKKGQRLVSKENQTNGLAAAFLTVGVSAYAGYFWPVTDSGATAFTRVFYNTLFEHENVGLAFMEARKETICDLEEWGELTGCSAVLYGDAGSAHRQDLATAN